MSDVFPEYPKINSIQKRHIDGPHKHQFTGEWANPLYGELQDAPWVCREKIDGTNIRVRFDFVDGGSTVRIGGRTDKAQMPGPLGLRLDEIFRDPEFAMSVETTFEPNPDTSITLYGEGFGAGIQKGADYGPVGFILFDVRIGHMWLLDEDVTGIAMSLNLPRVPIYEDITTLREAIDVVSHGDLPSHFPLYGEAEGIVAVTKSGLLDRRGNRVVAKVKGVDFPNRFNGKNQ